MGSTANRIVKNTGYLYAKMSITMLISLWTTRLILNSLGASDFGIFNIVGGAIGMMGFLNGSLASATQRFMSYYQGSGDIEKNKQIFNISIVLHFFISVIVVVALIVAGFFFFNGILNIPRERTTAAIIIYGSLMISTVFTVMTVPYDAALNAHENMKYYAIVGILESSLKLAVAYVVIYTFSDKLIVYGVLMTCIPIIIMAIMRVYCHRHYEECTVSVFRYWDKGTAVEMARFAGWNFFGSMTSLIANHGGGIVVNHFFSTVANAALGIASQLNGQLLAFSNAMLKAVNPVIVKKEGAKETSEMIAFSFLGCKYSYMIFLMILTPFFIEAPYILKLWLKEVPEWTVILTRLQLMRTLLEQFTITLGTSLAACGKIKQLNVISSVGNVLALPALYVVFYLGFTVPYYYAVIIPLLVIVNSASKLYYCHWYCQMRYVPFFVQVIYPCMIVTITSFASGYIISSLMDEGLIRLLVVGAVTISAFAMSFYITLSKMEKEYVITLLKMLYGKVKLC